MQETKITVQETTNQTIIKFNSNKILINGGSYEFSNIDEAKNSPLAQQLFYLPFVKKVFITANFIAIQRFDIVEWIDVQEEVREQIEAYITDGNIVVNEQTSSTKKEAIEVYAEVTPNPSVMKFGTNKALTQTDVEYKNIDEANQSSPLAQAIFTFPFVKQVFISDNYISITKYEMVEWNEVFTEVRTFIREYLVEGKTIIKEIPDQEITSETTIKTPTIALEGVSAQIVEILDEYIKPAVAGDGGNIAFRSYDEEHKIVSVVLQGACSGCPSSTATLKNGIETLLKEMLPNQINEVIAING
ncbi:Fe-S cluster biogenesis protein NfuA, 4Fe-4S-binding domain [Polaribacter sp. Hel1_33_78]|jgi:Fe-S cluster biogenesis protein NfuA|uniref:NifU family protein n=1 Tax=Polaribacter sp. Hel1_33_78 TaxID=1336804 RepID=UPI000879BEDD|nr:NifU family protein [Polaribacter sp. Hel1_33_78]MBT3741951.1 NifU family protein [Polaribacter sp.]MBT4412720.1 NifU family protein [Polaribacter sp.]MDG2435604.1 NifU family protein [Polaribacter sp.]SDU22938.1 Fe-S cluster biogenesis protein NfuA, 4Fe-4S-binding domain [Polaribacter sp. Hel1_33_78]